MKILPRTSKKLTYSPLRYPGGKASLYNFISELTEVKQLQNITYVEPYAGGAGAALALLITGKVKKIIINDLDDAIYSFWISSIFEAERFIKKMIDTPVTMEEWRRQKSIYKNNTSSLFEKGFATFYLNRANRSGVIEGGPIGGIKQEGRWKIDARFNKNDLIDRIKKIASFKNKITVKNKDGIDLLHSLKNRKKILIYLDPPYFEKGSFLYLNHYKKDDHLNLSNFLNKNSNLNWILSYDNNISIKEMYAKRHRELFTLNYSVYKKTKGSELMIFSDSMA